VYRTVGFGIVCVLVACFTPQPVGAAKKFPEYPARPAGEYAAKAEKSGVVVGAEPVEDISEQETYFREKLTPKGSLPVFIVIENHTSKDSFVFDKTEIGFSGEAEKPVKLQNAFSTKQENIELQELRSKTLAPGQSTHGFLYIPVPKKGSRDRIHLQVPITKAGTSEVFVLNLFF
jgi:hypothetical protein